MECKKCGQCCYLVVNGEPTDTPCERLKFKPDGTTYCDIYKDRIGTDLGYKYKCVYRKHGIFDYWECPYNTNKSMVKNHKVVGQ